MKKKSKVVISQSPMINDSDFPEVKRDKMIDAIDMNSAYAFIEWDDGEKSWLVSDGDGNFTYEMGGSTWTLDFEVPLKNGLVVISTGSNRFNMLHEK